MDPATLADLAADPSRLDHLSEEEVADVLADLERLRAQCWTRLHLVERPPTNGNETDPGPDRMLNADTVAEILEVDTRYVYDHADDWPFTRRISPRTLRFSEQGLYRWLDTRR